MDALSVVPKHSKKRRPCKNQSENGLFKKTQRINEIILYNVFDEKLFVLDNIYKEYLILNKKKTISISKLKKLTKTVVALRFM